MNQWEGINVLNRAQVALSATFALVGRVARFYFLENAKSVVRKCQKMRTHHITKKAK